MTGEGAGELGDDLRALAREKGVLVSYVDHGEVPQRSPDDSIVAVLEAMGESEAGRDPRRALAEVRARRSLELVTASVVVAAGARRSIPLSPAAIGLSLECELTTEDGETHAWSAPPVTADRGRTRPSLELPREVEPGYHVLRLAAGGREAICHVLARPSGGARGRFDDAWRALGVAAPAFTLHSERSWGCGDLTDLDRLAALVAPHGASVVATLPLLAGFGPEPFEPSPYLPSSRQFWHERWIDVDAALGDTPPSRTAAIATDVRRNVREVAARAHPYVDGARAMAAQQTVLTALLADLEGERSGRLDELDAYCAARPELLDFARFRATADRLGTDWHRWPVRERDGRLDDGDRGVRYHAFVQWLVHCQLVDVVRRCDARGQVLALDLPLGVHPNGYDAWRHRDQYLGGLEVGAPPDRFFPRGQAWSFPPPDLDAARRSGHALFRAALAHHLRVASMLRIDHVLGLQRLFCVPHGAPPGAGVYVECPLEELLAVVAIEAQRHHASIVGEDLGTVDAAVRRAMARDGLRRYFAVALTVGRGGSTTFPAPPPGSVASFTTHDLATFDGWWEGRDVTELVELGQVDDDAGAAMLATRRAERAALATLVTKGVKGALGSDSDEPPPGLLDAALARLARSDAGLVVAQLDDVLGEHEGVNLPGTSVERRNWARRTSVSLDVLEASGALAATFDPLHEVRPSVAPETAREPRGPADVVHGVTRFGDVDDHLFNEGRHARLFEKLGAHAMTVDGEDGTYFSVWAPAARGVEIVGDFNSWDGARHALVARASTGIWEGFVPGVGEGERYKYRVTPATGAPIDKADPVARRTESPPLTASVTGELHHEWGDAAWMAARAQRQALGAPLSIYEVHLGSWRRVPEDANRPLTYRELAPRLIEHVARLGCTHVELLPVMEHPFYGSWGYHVTGFFAPTARYGEPDDFAALVDELHQAGIGVLLDWVPAHFPEDAFALARFDGTHLYEHADPRQGVHPDWRSLIFNYGRHEVRSFLLSAACSWVERFHVDGLRFDAVASMLYLDYSRGPGEWVPNRLGGRENLDAVEFLTGCTDQLHEAYPGVLAIAEESTAWPGVTAPTSEGGLGFDYKWDLGWMHDTLAYLHRDPVHRRWHQDELTFRTLYARTEQYLLPLSHDEVVHGKGSLLRQMAGDRWQQFANLRLLFGYQLIQPGKKLVFMGDEFGQDQEWSHDRSLDWHLVDEPAHAGLLALVARLNALYREHPALHRDDLVDRGFAWIDGNDRDLSVTCIERHDDADDVLVVVSNATPEPRDDYHVGMPREGAWTLVCSSDETRFGGSGYDVRPTVTTWGEPLHGRASRASLVLPPLGFVIYRPGT